MELTLYQVDAFTREVFSGNPAAVCPLREWLPDEVMQRIALENNLSETAFFVEEGDGYRIRWFTPDVEVDLCGHATLASAYVVFRFVQPGSTSVRFLSHSGALGVEQNTSGELVLDFPADRPGPVGEDAPPALVRGLGRTPEDVRRSGTYWLAVFPSEDSIRALQPDMGPLSEIDPVIASAPGDSVDFVSRMFAPSKGVPEDPVTGSAHCVLTPYWSERLGKTKLAARQISRRGGDLGCELRGDRVRIAGYAALYMKATISF
jgi:PhzF family phenazine biosynthesis protein